jgi:hypothetical protein
MMFPTLSTVTDQIDTLKGALRFRFFAHDDIPRSLRVRFLSFVGKADRDPVALIQINRAASESVPAVKQPGFKVC